MMFCKKNVVLHGHFVICICPCLEIDACVDIGLDVASVIHYLNAIKAKQSALNARKPWSAVGNPTSAVRPSGNRARASAIQSSCL